MNKLIKRFWRWPLSGIAVAVTILALGVLTASSMNTTQPNSTQVPERRISVANEKNKALNARLLAAQQIQIDPQTGQIRPLTPAEAQKLADGMKELVSQSSDGLVPVQRPDGLVSIDLQGRFQSVAVAKKVEGDNIAQSCVDSTEAAADFFGISHQLFDPSAKSSAAGKKATAPVKQPTPSTSGKGELK